MRVVVMLMALGTTGLCMGQEETHLEGSRSTFPISENEIVAIAQKREILEMEVLAYPNPSNGQVFIEGTHGSTVTVHSDSGIYVGTWVIGEEQKIEITDLTTGSFICTVISNNHKTVKKIIVL